MLYLYGDSHARSSFKGLTIPHDCRSEPSVTMHRIGRDKGIVNWTPCAPNDTVVLSYGEVDCRGHIGKQIDLGRDEDEVISELTSPYVDTIRSVVSCRVVVVAVIPPTTRAEYEAENPDGGFPFVSSDADRVRYTAKVNASLAAHCKRLGFVFFDPYGPYTREDGCLRRELSDGNVHVGDTRHVLSQFSSALPLRIAYCLTGFARTIHPQRVVDEALKASLPPNSQIDLFWACPTQLDHTDPSVYVDTEALLDSFRGTSIRSVYIQWFEYTPSFFQDEVEMFLISQEILASTRMLNTLSQVYNISRSVGLAYASGKEYDLVIITRNDYIPCVDTYGIPSPVKRGVYAYRTCPYRTNVGQVGLGEDHLDTEDRAFYGTPEEMLAFRTFYTQLPNLFTHPKLYTEVLHTKFLRSKFPEDCIHYQDGIQIRIAPKGNPPPAAAVPMVEDRHVPIDSPHQGAFAHWVFDSAIRLPELRRNGKKIVLSVPRDYKRLFCDYFGFEAKDITYDVRAHRSPMLLVRDPPTADYASRISSFRALFSSSVTPDVDFVILPRQTKENYSPNDRPCPLTPFLDVFRSRSHRIVHTDTITSLQTQIDLVNSGRTVIVTDGSPALVNGMFCSGKVIYVVRADMLENQSVMYPGIALILAEIRKKNELRFIDGTMLASLVEGHILQ